MFTLYHPEHRRPQPGEFCIWLDDREYLFAVVDEIDWHWAKQWRWHARPDKHGNKFYACRQQTLRNNGHRTNASLYLHVEIMKRTGIKPRSPAFTMADHRSGCEFDCTRKNLRWATPSMNRRNIRGALAFDLEELSHER